MDTIISQLLRKSPLHVLIRILIAGPFILAAMSKIAAFEGNARYLQYGSSLLEIPAPALLLALVILFQVLASTLVIVNRWFAATAACLLALFCLFTAIFYHAFAADAASLGDMADQLLVVKNIAWAGGLLALAALSNRPD